jgi:tRNA-Thr(GGU) m(6)t(6)A37 methyltransferase TsaA
MGGVVAAITSGVAARAVEGIAAGAVFIAGASGRRGSAVVRVHDQSIETQSETRVAKRRVEGCIMRWVLRARAAWRWFGAWGRDGAYAGFDASVTDPVTTVYPTARVDPLTLQPIGVIRTPYTDRYRAPRQPGVADEGREGVIELVPGLNLEQAVADLAGVERIWVIVWFHRNVHWRTKVLPPRGGRVKRSVLATRSPHRPNPLGLSVLRLLEVRGRTLRVADVDLLDGTPVLDIKPYIPYADAFPESRAGWLDAVERDDVTGVALHEVVWSEHARSQVEWLREMHGVIVGDVAVPALARDPAPHPYRRILHDADGGLMIAEKSWRIHFRVDEGTVTITRVSSGYRREVLAAGDPSAMLDGEAHLGFAARWP